MKNKDELRLRVLRLYLSKVTEKEIELRSQNQELTDEIAYKVLKKRIKETNKSIDLYRDAKRYDLVDKESNELDILEEFARLFPEYN